MIKQKMEPKKNKTNQEDLTFAVQELIKRTTPRYHFLSGIFSGLGTVFGATVVLTFILYILTRLSFVPVLGDIATQIVRIVHSNLSL